MAGYMQVKVIFQIHFWQVMTNFWKVKIFKWLLNGKLKRVLTKMIPRPTSNRLNWLYYERIFGIVWVLTKFYQIKWPVKMSFQNPMWPVMYHIWQDIVLWSAVILSPGITLVSTVITWVRNDKLSRQRHWLVCYKAHFSHFYWYCVIPFWFSITTLSFLF